MPVFGLFFDLNSAPRRSPQFPFRSHSMELPSALFGHNNIVYCHIKLRGVLPLIKHLKITVCYKWLQRVTLISFIGAGRIDETTPNQPTYSLHTPREAGTSTTLDVSYGTITDQS